MLLQDLDILESKSYQALFRNLDLHAFKVVSSQITKFAIKKIARDWEACKQVVSTKTTENIANEQYSYELLLCFSLPCKYYLLQAAQTRQLLPKSLFHPCW